MRSHFCTEISEKDVGKIIEVAGWCNTYRDHGGVIFIDLRDKSGLVQLVCDPSSKAYEADGFVVKSNILEIHEMLKKTLS